MARDSKRPDRRRQEIAEYDNRGQRKRKPTREQERNRNRRRKKKSKRRRRKFWTTGKKVALGFCVLLLLLVIGGIAFVAAKIGKIQTVELDKDKLSIYSDLQYEESGYLNVALFGLDTRENDLEMGTRSDTIMIASLNRETKEVKLSSVYRDTLLLQADGTYNKANSAYNTGGTEEAIAMLNRNLDLDIQHFVSVDFAALVHVIDALGGIEIDVTEEEIEYINGYATEIIKNTGVDTWAVTEPGYQTLTGVQATAYARIRYTAGDDFKRAERQRTVLMKIAEKLQQADLTTLNTIIDEVFPMVETNFTLMEVFAYAKDIAKYQLGETVGFPFERDTMLYGNNGDCVIPITLASNVEQLHAYFFPELSYTPSYEVQDISANIEYIYSGSGYTYDDTGTYY